MSHTIISSHGHFQIDENGEVLSHEVSPSWDAPIPISFDVDEFRRTYGRLDGAIDILDIGYTMPDGEYEPPEPDFRANVSPIVP